MATPDTRLAILDAAESLFAEQGIENTSLRTITSVAKVNLAAVHYHFGSKESLITEVFARRLAPINEARLQRLDAAEAAAGGEALELETLVRAFLEPVFQMDWSEGGDGPDVKKLMGRVYGEPQDLMNGMLTEHFQDVIRRFGSALARSLPEHKPAELFWRFHFAVGAMAHTLQCNLDLRPFAFDQQMPLNVQDALEPLVAFVVAGMRGGAPVTASQDKPKARGRSAGLLAALFGVLLSACGTPPRVEIEHGVDTPDGWQADATTAESEDATEALLGWWRTFGDPGIETAVGECLQHNRDLQAAAARVEAAAHQARIAGADLYPQVNGSLNGARQRQVFVGFPFGGGGVPSTTFENYGLALNLTWELDVWGRIRAGEAAALADAEAAAWDFAGARLSLVGQTCKVWFAHVTARLQRDVANRTVESFSETRDTVQQRFAAGLSPALDLRQAERDLATAGANLAGREEQLERTVRQLEVLLGRYPEGRATSGPDLPTTYEPVPVGIPAELLSRRPDLRAAERRLAAADQRLDQARAALLPRLSLTAGGGTNTGEFSDILDDDFRVWNIGGNLLQPLFQGGRLLADIDRNEADVRAVVADYAAVLLQAFAEVEQALAVERRLAERESQLATAEGHSLEALQLAQERYAQGLTDFLTVSATQQAWLASQAELLAVRQARLDSRVDLFLALGGGFPLPEDIKPQEGDPEYSADSDSQQPIAKEHDA